jgi:hypothetical protein
VSESEPSEWTMTVISRAEAEAMYEMRRRFVSPKKIAKEFGKSVTSTKRAIGYIALERRTYGSAWTRMRLEHNRGVRARALERYAERDRRDKIAKQSAAEHAEMVLLAGAALAPSPRETRAEREARAEWEAMSGTVKIAGSADGHVMEHGRGRSALPPPSAQRVPLTSYERESKRKAKRLREMLGPNPMRHELGLE